MKILAALALCLCITTAQADLFRDAALAFLSQDYATASRLLPPLAEQGNANALSNLGVMYSQGVAVPQDYVEAHKWANLAASRQTEEERRNQAIINRDFVANKMTPGQIAEAQKLAKQWDKAHPR
jgi:TPR repeat protein